MTSAADIRQKFFKLNFSLFSVDCQGAIMMSNMHTLSNKVLRKEKFDIVHVIKPLESNKMQRASQACKNCHNPLPQRLHA